MSSYAAIGPFESVFAEAHVYRQASESPRNLIVLLGVWLVFGMLALGGATVMVAFRTESIVASLSGGFFFVVAVAMLWKTTRNYMRKPNRIERKDG